MTALPEKVSQAWEKRSGPIVFATHNESGQPNIIYATCVSKFDEETLIIADNYFDKTRQNILSGCKGAVLFMTSDSEAFQIKGRVEYHTEGELYKNMKSWNPQKHPGHAAAVLKIEEVYAGASKLA